jgi:hypothetical protein
MKQLVSSDESSTETSDDTRCWDAIACMSLRERIPGRCWSAVWAAFSFATVMVTTVGLLSIGKFLFTLRWVQLSIFFLWGAGDFRTPLNQIDLQSPYVPVHGLETTVRQVVCGGIDGVHLLALPSDTGKSTTVIHVANRALAANNVSGVFYVKFGDFPKATTISGMFEQKGGWVENTFHDRVNLASAKWPSNTKTSVLLIVDGVENRVLQQTFVDDITWLATRSSEDHKFRILMTINNTSLAEQMFKWNDRTKIAFAPRSRHREDNIKPTRQELQTHIFNQNLTLSAEMKRVFLELADLSSSMGLVPILAEDFKSNPQSPEDFNMTWFDEAKARGDAWQDWRRDRKTAMV